MTKKELTTLADKYQQKADRALQNYQETGITRYDRERRNNEDLADAMRMAADAAEDHGKMLSLRYALSRLATQAKDIEFLDGDRRTDALEKLRRELLASGRMEGVIS